MVTPRGRKLHQILPPHSSLTRDPVYCIYSMKASQGPRRPTNLIKEKKQVLTVCARFGEETQKSGEKTKTLNKFDALHSK